MAMDPETLFDSAIKYKDDPAAVERFLHAQGDPNSKACWDTVGEWPLLVGAAGAGRVKTAQMLVEAGASLELQDSNGWTALITAAMHGQLAMVQYLLGVGADARACCHGKNAKQWAQQWASSGPPSWLPDVKTDAHAQIAALLAAPPEGQPPCNDCVKRKVQHATNIEWLMREIEAAYLQIAVANYVGDADDCAAGARKDAKQEMQKLKRNFAEAQRVKTSAEAHLESLEAELREAIEKRTDRLERMENARLERPAVPTPSYWLPSNWNAGQAELRREQSAREWNVQTPDRNEKTEVGNPGRRTHIWEQVNQDGEPSRWQVLPRSVCRQFQHTLEIVGERLAQGSQEFEMVEDMLNGSVGSHKHKYGLVGGTDPHGFRATAILRVQNKVLWEDYMRNKEKLLRKYEGQPGLETLASSKYLRDKPMKTPMLDASTNEHWLFHGTDWRTSAILCSQGYDNRVASPTGMFGAGFYLAEDFSKSNQYIPCPMCKRNAIHTRGKCECQSVQPELGFEGDKLEYSMVVYRACLGDPHIATVYDRDKYRGTTGKPVRRPPDKPAPRPGVSSMEQHDCVIGESMANGGNKLQFREVIFYDRGLAYPEYLVSFTRVAPPALGEWHKLKTRVCGQVKTAFDNFYGAYSPTAKENPAVKALLTNIKDPSLLRSVLVGDVLKEYKLCKDGLSGLPTYLEADPTADQTKSLEAALDGLEKLNDFWPLQEKMKSSGLADEFLKKCAHQEPEPEPEPADGQ